VPRDLLASSRHNALTCVPPTELVAGDLCLDTVTATVTRSGVPVHLTPREYDLLHHLIRSKGHVVSRSGLLEEVWGMHHNGIRTNVVAVYVGYLRRKIDTPFGRHSLRTVRGYGYRLSPDGG
jgi:DNA-binding response OmpR family regulator